MKRLVPAEVSSYPERTRIVIKNDSAGRYALHMILKLDDAARQERSK